MKIVSVEKLVWGTIINDLFVLVNPRVEKAQLFYIEAAKERNRKAVDINTGKIYSISSEVPYGMLAANALYNNVKREYVAGKMFYPFINESLKFDKRVLDNNMKSYVYDTSLITNKFKSDKFDKNIIDNNFKKPVIDAKLEIKEADVIKNLIVKAQKTGGILNVNEVNYIVKLQNEQVEKNLKYNEEKMF